MARRSHLNGFRLIIDRDHGRGHIIHRNCRTPSVCILLFRQGRHCFCQFCVHVTRAIAQHLLDQTLAASLARVYRALRPYVSLDLVESFLVLLKVASAHDFSSVSRWHNHWTTLLLKLLSCGLLTQVLLGRFNLIVRVDVEQSCIRLDRGRWPLNRLNSVLLDHQIDCFLSVLEVKFVVTAFVILLGSRDMTIRIVLEINCASLAALR